MEQDNSEYIHLSLSCYPENSLQFSELQLFVSTVWTVNPRICEVVGNVNALTVPHHLCHIQNVREVIDEMLTGAVPSVRILLEPCIEEIVAFTYENSWLSPSGLIYVVAEIMVYTNEQPRWVFDPELPWIEAAARLAEEVDEVEQALMMSFTEADFNGVPATMPAIKDLDTLIYEGNGEGCRETECAICLEDFETGAELNKMPCSHAFHQICLSNWLEQNHKCPLCRFSLSSEQTEET